MNLSGFGHAWSKASFNVIKLLESGKPSPLKPIQSCQLANKGQDTGKNSSENQCLSPDFEPCDLETMTITTTVARSPMWDHFFSMGWLGELLRDSVDQPFHTITLAPMSGMPVPPARIAGDVKLSSAHLEFLAPEGGANAQKGSGLKLKIETTTGPGYCAKHSHPTFDIAPKPQFFLETLPKSRTQSQEIELFSEPIAQPGQSDTPFRFIGAMMSGADLSKTYEIKMESCGARNSHLTVGSLICDIQVFPEKLITVELSIPEILSSTKTLDRKTSESSSYGEAKVTSNSTTKSIEKYNRLGAKDADGNRVVRNETSEKFTERTVVDSSGMITRQEQYDVKTKTETSGSGWQNSSKTHKEGLLENKTDDNSEPLQSYSSTAKPENVPAFKNGISLSVTYDGLQYGGKWLDVVHKISEIKKAIQTASDLANLLEKSVQIGWKVTGTLKMFSGDVKAVWGLKQVSKEARVARYFGLKVDVMVIDLSCTASFGIKAAFPKIKSLDAGATLSGTLSGNLSVNGGYEQLTNYPSKGTNVAVTGEVIIKFKLQIVLSEIFCLEGEIFSGIECTGSWAGGIHQEPECKLEASTKDVIATARYGIFFNLIKRKYGPATLIKKVPLGDPIKL